MTEPNGTTRRILLAGAGALGATAALAGCDAAGSGAAGAAGTGDAGASGGAGTALGTTGDVPVGGGTIFADAQVVVTQPSAGTFKAFSSICTHQGCPLTGVEGGTINCNCHGSRFSVEDGSVRTGPATEPLPSKQIKVDGDRITLA